MMGLSFEGVEEEACAFFARLEKVQKNKDERQELNKAGGNRVSRKLGNLECSISYEKGKLL